MPEIRNGKVKPKNKAMISSLDCLYHPIFIPRTLSKMTSFNLWQKNKNTVIEIIQRS
jgi:hypothetical protein